MPNKHSDDALSSRRRKSGAILSYAYSLAQVVVNLAYVPLLLFGIGRDEYGLYQLIGSVMAYMAIMNSTFSGGTTRFYCKYYAQGDELQMENTLATCARIYRVVSVAAIGIGAVAIVAVRIIYAHVLTEFQIWESSVMLAVLVANLIVTMNNTISVAVINAHERFAFLKGTQLFTVIAQPFFVLLMIKVFPYALTIACVQFALNVLCALAQRYFARSILGAKVILHENNKVLLRELLVFSSSILLVTLADQIFWKTNQLVLGYYFGTGVVAVYGIASQIYMAYMPIGWSISAVYMPKISKLYFEGRDMGAISALFAKVGRLSLYPLLAVLLGFIAFGPDFIRLWAGEGFEDAYLIAVLIMVPFTVDLAQNLGLTIMQVMNKYHFRGKMYLSIAVLNIVAVLIVAPVYGGIGAAACTGIAMLIGNGVVSNIYYKRAMKLDVGLFWSEVTKMALSLVTLGAVVTLAVNLTVAGTLNWVTFFMGLCAYAILFCLVAWLFSSNEYERGLVKSVIRKMMGRSRK